MHNYYGRGLEETHKSKKGSQLPTGNGAGTILSNDWFSRQPYWSTRNNQGCLEVGTE